MIKRKASAKWQGDLKSGRGVLTTESEILAKTPYSFSTRFEGQKGTNPEELIAAAHAGCFAMALSAELQKRQLAPESLDVQATVQLGKSGEEWQISDVHLQLSADVPGISPSQFEEAAQSAKSNCPVSKLLKANITLESRLNSR